MTNTSAEPGKHNPRLNRFLATLNNEDLAALMSEAKIVKLKYGTRIIRQDTRVDAVYFPLTCMFSLLVTHNEKLQMELATIGSESLIGASEALQSLGAVGLCLIQIPGTAVRIHAEAFRRLSESRLAVTQLVSHHSYALLRQVLYGAACNRNHSMQERCARWLLMTQDCAGSDTFPLTQEFLSHMLGVRRATVNVATGMLKNAGFIHYLRGQMTVTNRAGLESASCGCYKAIVEVYDTLRPNSKSEIVAV